MRSQIVIASSWSWVTKIVVMPSRRCRREQLAGASARAASRRGWRAARRAAAPAARSRSCARARRAAAGRRRAGSGGARRSRRGRPARARRRRARRTSSRGSLRSSRPKATLLRHRHVRPQRVVLEHHADVALPRRDAGHVARRRSSSSPGLVLVEAGDQPQQRRLARARGAEQREELARLDRQVDVAQHLVAAVARAAMLRASTLTAFMRDLSDRTAVAAPARAALEQPVRQHRCRGRRSRTASTPSAAPGPRPAMLCM